MKDLFSAEIYETEINDSVTESAILDYSWKCHNFSEFLVQKNKTFKNLLNFPEMGENHIFLAVI